MPINHLMFSGYAISKPEFRYLPNGSTAVNFQVAVLDTWFDESGAPWQRVFCFDIVAFGDLADTCRGQLQYGAKVLVEGRLSCDPKTGGPRLWMQGSGFAKTSFEVRATKIEFALVDKDEQAQQGQHVAAIADPEARIVMEEVVRRMHGLAEKQPEVRRPMTPQQQDDYDNAALGAYLQYLEDGGDPDAYPEDDL